MYKLQSTVGRVGFHSDNGDATNRSVWKRNVGVCLDPTKFLRLCLDEGKRGEKVASIAVAHCSIFRLFVIIIVLL